MDMVNMLLSNPAVSAALMGMAVKVAVDQLKKVFKKVDDEDLGKKYAVPVQLLVGLCTLVATLGDLALQDKLSTADPNLITNYLTAVFPVMLAALGFQKAGNIVLGKEDPKVK